ncbi:non-specific serine/threonine protein kinase [Anaeramoeba flamelloides]|uniref:non-specific serine/threonine protein kinase n=1 Tax=Anaeramoeba flamelloides TaxID=1746091 RepID=A0ABQ8YAA3_9EUKA|nr:non-specific serine/threonine protein kinase [Anaeramoeba flamelloides]
MSFWKIGKRKHKKTKTTEKSTPTKNKNNNKTKTKSTSSLTKKKNQKTNKSQKETKNSEESSKSPKSEITKSKKTKKTKKTKRIKKPKRTKELKKVKKEVPLDKVETNEHTIKKSKDAKQYLENYFSNLGKSSRERLQRRRDFEESLKSQKLTKKEASQIRNEFYKKENIHNKLKTKKLQASDFEILKIIGKGAFGIVCLAREKITGDVYAMKILNKQKMIKQGQVDHARTERDLMVTIDNPWIVTLYYSFQDETYLYLIMEYVVGGDMMTHLIKREILTEDETRFYIAETVAAVSKIHSMNFIHRDLKPDNLLIDKNGHILLTDFGLSKNYQNILTQMENQEEIEMPKKTKKKRSKKPQQLRQRTWKERRKLAFSTVGTPDYIAIEIFWRKGYSETCDWWSLGVIMFEMLFGFPPFASESRRETFQMILNWNDYLVFPEDIFVSEEAKDLINKLVCAPNDRLGNNGVTEIKSHPFFHGIDWDKIEKRKMTPPYIPKVNGETDTRHFEDFEDEFSDEEENFLSDEDIKQLEQFEGYTYKRVNHQQPKVFIKEWLNNFAQNEKKN